MLSYYLKTRYKQTHYKPVDGPPIIDMQSDISSVKFVMPPCSADWIRKELKYIKVDKSVGLDDISGAALHFGAPVIASSIRDIFNLSLSSGVFSKSFKMAKVIPVFKSGDASS